MNSDEIIQSIRENGSNMKFNVTIDRNVPPETIYKPLKFVQRNQLNAFSFTHDQNQTVTNFRIIANIVLTDNFNTKSNKRIDLTWPQFRAQFFIGANAVATSDTLLSELYYNPSRSQNNRSSELFSLLRGAMQLPVLVANKIIAHTLCYELGDTELLNMCTFAPIELQEAMIQHKSTWEWELPVHTDLQMVPKAEIALQASKWNIGVRRLPSTKNLESCRFAYDIYTRAEEDEHYWEQNQMFIEYLRDQLWLQEPKSNINCRIFPVVHQCLANAFLLYIEYADQSNDGCLEKIIVNMPQLPFRVTKESKNDIATLAVPNKPNWYCLPLSQQTRENAMYSRDFSTALHLRRGMEFTCAIECNKPIKRVYMFARVANIFRMCNGVGGRLFM